MRTGSAAIDTGGSLRPPSRESITADTERLRRVRAIFDRVADAPTGDWDGLVADASGGDAQIGRAVLRLLGEARDDRFHLDDPTLSLGEPADLPENATRVGSVIARYRLVRLVGYGGMGAVYEGVRSDDEYHQRVAVKLIRPELVGGRMASRFRRERQILAALEHRNIARLFDGGTSDQGEPFFVMEFVEGTPITKYCGEHHLTVEQRLRLFLQVCGAVSHAHGKLVVHRDLKPANMLVTADGSVKLLDFGVAKLLGAQDGSPVTGGLETVTQLGHPLTPEYASPEQLRDEPVSAASDVYSLGVVLYELMAGCRPFTLSPRSAVAALRALESTPLRPSSMATSEAAESAGELSVARLRNKLSGELDNVVLKAIRREPDRRYASVEQLAQDIHCYLDGLPVGAQPDSAVYRTEKFVRRHAAAVFAGAIAVLALVAGTTISVVQERRADSQRAETGRINAFLKTMLSEPDARHSGTANSNRSGATISDLLDAAAHRAATDLSSDPAVQSSVNHTIGITYIAIGRYDAGVAQLHRALSIDRRNAAPDLPNIAVDLLDLGEADLERGDNSAADTLFRSVLSICGADRPVADSTRACVVALNDLGGATWFENKLPESEQLLRRGVVAFSHKWGASSMLTAIALGNLGGVLDSRGKLAEAQIYYRRALASYSAAGRGDLPQAAFTLTNLAENVNEQGDAASAIPLVQRAIDIISRSESPDHPDAALGWVQLGALNRELGNLSLARAQTTRGLAILARAGPIARRLFVQAQTSAGLMLLAEHKPGAARKVLGGALDSASAEFRPDDPRFADVQDAVGEDLLALHMHGAAESVLAASHTTLAAALGANHPRTVRAARDLERARSPAY